MRPCSALIGTAAGKDASPGFGIGTGMGRKEGDSGANSRARPASGQSLCSCQLGEAEESSSPHPRKQKGLLEKYPREKEMAGFAISVEQKVLLCCNRKDVVPSEGFVKERDTQREILFFQEGTFTFHTKAR